ncbi:MAG TPA: rhodanese-related sulfurtransferase [Chitinophagaceae bacterium]|nr:rhodanese-related sulfurtransferase [Chitinophagaceae bacterium]
MALHNRVSAEELKKQLAEETFERVTISFYKYGNISDPESFRDELYRHLFEMKVFGRIYVAEEGINAQISVPDFNMDAFRDYLNKDDYLKDIHLNIAIEHTPSFWVLKIKVRDKIVADGINDSSFSVENRGSYLDAEAFNKLTDNPETIVVDMRNHYEYEVGHFEGAREVPSNTFREQLPMTVDMLKEEKDKNIVMYCTGGIRCEKASAWLRYNGFQNVFHLKGGIINYVHKAKEQELPLKFHGKNFVFDRRLGERVTNEVLSKCHQCGKPSDRHVNCKNEGCHLLFIQCEECAKKYNDCCSEDCMHVLKLPEEEQRKQREGRHNGQKIFNKSRDRMEQLKQ